MSALQRLSTYRAARPQAHDGARPTASETRADSSSGSSAVAELGGGLPEVDAARHNEDISPKRVAAVHGTHFVRIDPNVAPDLRASHR